VPYGDDVANRLVPGVPLPVIPLAGQYDPTNPAAVLAGVDSIVFNGVIRPSFAALQEIGGLVEADADGDGQTEPFTHRNESTITRDSKVFMIGARGDLNETWEFDASFSYSDEDSSNTFRDAVTQRVEDALNGYFGVNCDRFDPAQTPGTGDCTWFNPFGSSLLEPDKVVLDGNGNPHTLGNDPAAVKALEGTGVTSSETRLTVAEAIVSTNEFLGWNLAGGSVGFAMGMQYREDRMSTGGNDLATDPSFPLAFTGPSIPFSADDDVYAVFGEMALPVLEGVDVQLALRYEDYGGETGDTLDPKIAVRWQALDNLVLRGSAGTSFRGPSLYQRFGRGTGLQFMAPPSAEVIAAEFPGLAGTSPFGSGVFARLPTFGNPDLDPETSTNFNVGVIWDATEDLRFTADYWSYQFEDIIVGDDARGLINDCQIQWQAAGRPASRDAQGDFTQAYLDVEACNFRDLDNNASTPDIFLDTQGNPLSAQTSFTNGSEMNASGVDFGVAFSKATDWGIFSSNLDLSWFAEFEADSLVTPFDTRLDPGQTVDLVGKSEQVLVARPLPEWKGTLYNAWNLGSHNATLSVNYVSDVTESAYDDYRVDDHTTVDSSYTYSFEQVDLALTLGAVNLFDEDPPTANGGFNGYVPTLHDPRGRLWYLRARYRL
jgi:outer membrane receptor protein involved in Fe transport